MVHRANSGGSGKQGQQQAYDCCSGAQKQQQLLAAGIVDKFIDNM